MVNFEDIVGTGSGDQLTGNDVANTIKGGEGDDIITGGEGIDTLYGGSGSDVFKFTSVSDTGTGSGSRDIIKDFNAGTSDTSIDKIDLTGLSTSEFSFIGTNDFASDGSITQIRVTSNAGSSLIQIDADADSVVDTEIELSGFDGTGLDQNDFTAG